METQNLSSVVDKINTLTHAEMARLVRFAPSGHLYFIRDTMACRLFESRFKLLGGMTPEVSKLIGWEDKDEERF